MQKHQSFRELKKTERFQQEYIEQLVDEKFILAEEIKELQQQLDDCKRGKGEDVNMNVET